MSPPSRSTRTYANLGQLSCVGWVPPVISGMGSRYDLVPVPPEMPVSHYQPATMKVEMLDKGLTKFCDQKVFDSTKHFLKSIISEFNLPVDEHTLYESLMLRFDKEFPCMGLFLGDVKGFDEILSLMTHNRHGVLRDETSCGYGFSIGRKQLARDYPEAVKAFYDYDDLTLPILFKVALKDEFRKINKDTRSIFVPQIYLWLITMKHLGGLYDYFAFPSHKYGIISFGLDNTVSDATMNFHNFDFEAYTYGFDLKQQDSKMSSAYIEFLVDWLKTKLPLSRHDVVDYIFDEGYLSKKIVDRFGNVVVSSNGEPSGFPLTILINSFHTFFLHSLSDITAQFKGCSCSPVHRILGDDSISQMCHPQYYPLVCNLMNHDVVEEFGRFSNDVSFLSMQFNTIGNIVEPYYGNLDKAYASLRYTTNSHDEYFSKLNSFRLLLALAPVGSEAKDLLDNLDEYTTWYYKNYGMYLEYSKATFRLTSQNQGLLRSD